jgi:dihydrofolate synthase / folylpolyglutamate synthase
MPESLTLPAWLALLETRHPLAIDMGLDRVREVWQRMGKPQPATHIITVAGTNGKGSTTLLICSTLSALGFRCATYISPHLFQYNERVQILGTMVSDFDLTTAFEQIEVARGNISLSYFEFGTLAAIAIMAKAALDYAVLEVGLGGRLDAVNILSADCAVIAPIGLDHQEYLGNDREAIGGEKAGIIRAGRTVICGEPEPPDSILNRARELGSPVYRLGHEFSIVAHASGCTWRQGAHVVELPRPVMQGAHQVNNMATAVAAVVAVHPDSLYRQPLLAKGLSSVQLPGRLQQHASWRRVWLDVGHNPHAAMAVADALHSMGIQPAICVLGMLHDKDAAAVAEILDGSVQAWYCAGLEGARGRTGAALAREVASVSHSRKVKAFADVATALGAALADTTNEDSILVFGSFVSAGQAAVFLNRNC